MPKTSDKPRWMMHGITAEPVEGYLYSLLPPRDEVLVARPRGAADPGEQAAGLRVPAPVQVVREAAQALELRRDSDVARRRRGNADGGLHPADDIGVLRVS